MVAVRRDRKDTVAMLSFAVEEILGVNGLNLLGTYNLLSGTTVVGTSPAIAVNYPRLSNSTNTSTTSAKNIVKQVQPNSGIEAVINSEPDMMSAYFKYGNRQSLKYYEIVLDQWNPTGGLTEAVEALLVDIRLDINEEPVIAPARPANNNHGVLPPRALLYHRQKHFLVKKVS